MKYYKAKIVVVALAIFSVLMVCLGCGQKPVVESSNSKSTASVVESTGSDQLTIKMLDIGQGDALLIKTKDQVILMDTGDVETRDKIVALLKKEKVKKIDKLIISHPHADHLGGAYAVLNNFEVGSVYDNGQPATTATYRTYMKLIDQKKIPYQQLTDGMSLDFGQKVVFKVFSPTKLEVQKEDNTNSNSIVGKLTFGDFSMLFTGDCEADREKVILKKYKTELKSMILKSPHHGSKTSSNREYLKAVAPEVALISLAADNEYKHPHDVTLNKYKDLKIQVYRTDQSGTLTVISDGKTYKINKEK